MYMQYPFTLRNSLLEALSQGNSFPPFCMYMQYPFTLRDSLLEALSQGNSFPPFCMYMQSSPHQEISFWNIFSKGISSYHSACICSPPPTKEFPSGTSSLGESLPTILH